MAGWQWIMNCKGLVRKLSWPNLGTAPAFPWRKYEKPWKSLFRSHCISWNLSQAPHKYKSWALLPDQCPRPSRHSNQGYNAYEEGLLITTQQQVCHLRFRSTHDTNSWETTNSQFYLYQIPNKIQYSTACFKKIINHSIWGVGNLKGKAIPVTGHGGP
jgi:hypothetical protein